MQTAYQLDAADDASLEDFTPADFSAQPEEPSRTTADSASVAVSRNEKAAELSAAVMVSVDEGGDITVPDFSGKTMRDVSEQCLRLGLNPVLVGTSLATGQMPAAGAKVKHGAKVTVEFGTPEAKAAKLARTKN